MPATRIPPPAFVPPDIAAHFAALAAEKLRALSTRVEGIVTWLQKSMANAAHRKGVNGNLIMLFWNTFSRHMRHVREYMDQVAKGTLRLSPKPHIRTKRAAPVPRPKPELFVPRHRFWLGKMFVEVNPYGSQLGALLEDPDMIAFLTACARAKRPLRALWWALNNHPAPAILRAIRPPRATRAPKPPKPKPQKLNIPRNIMRAARAWRDPPAPRPPPIPKKPF